MNKGEVVERATTRDIFGNTQHEYTKKLLAAIPDSAKPQRYRFTPDLSAAPILSINRVSTSFTEKAAGFFSGPANYFKAVDDVSLDLANGEILGLVGESGCGKSTLAKTILRLVSQDSGSIKLQGRELTRMNSGDIRDIRKDLQIIFQDPYSSLNPRMSVYDILLEPLKLHHIVEKKEYTKAIIALMEEVGLSAADIRKYPHEFSGGQRQRIAIARALAVKPLLIIADEPVSALDVTVQAQVLELLLSLVAKHQLSMIFVSHDLSVIRYICDRTAVMFQGKIIELNDTELLFHNPQHEYTRKLLSAIPVPDPGFYGKA